MKTQHSGKIIVQFFIVLIVICFFIIWGSCLYMKRHNTLYYESAAAKVEATDNKNGASPSPAEPFFSENENAELNSVILPEKIVDDLMATARTLINKDKGLAINKADSCVTFSDYRLQYSLKLVGDNGFYLEYLGISSIWKTFQDADRVKIWATRQHDSVSPNKVKIYLLGIAQSNTDVKNIQEILSDFQESLQERIEKNASF